MTSSTTRLPLVRIMVGNASLLSAVYLVMAVSVEAVRRWLRPRWADHAAIAFERLPASVLELFGLLGPLRELYLEEKVGEFALRAILGGTTVLLIFFLAVVVGLAMWGVKVFLDRRSAG